MMSEQEAKLLDLFEKREVLEEELKKINEESEGLMRTLGYGHAFQADDGLVYQIYKPKGTFMYYRDIEYKRTRREGEKGGDFLAKKEAETMGFVV